MHCMCTPECGTFGDWRQVDRLLLVVQADPRYPLAMSVVKAKAGAGHTATPLGSYSIKDRWLPPVITSETPLLRLRRRSTIYITQLRDATKTRRQTYGRVVQSGSGFLGDAERSVKRKPQGVDGL